MAEYIEKQAALDAILREPPDAHYPSWYAERIKALPAADVMPVVYCKDCKYADTERKNATEKRYFNSILFCRNSNLCGDEPLAMWPDDFCSYGERKDGGADNG